MVRKWINALGLILSLALAACTPQAASQPIPQPGPSPQSGVAVDGGTAHLTMWSPPAGVFYPALATNAYDAIINQLIYKGLLRLGPNLELQPDLAESYSISDDKLTVTFKLLPDVKWQDGEPFTAQDVAFTFRQMLEKDYNGLRTGMFSRLSGAPEFRAGKTSDLPGIRVIDDRTIAFHTDEPYAPLLFNVGTWGIVPEHIFGKINIKDLAKDQAISHPVGTGPFKLQEYKPNQYVELVRNDSFFRGKPHLSRVIYHIVDQQVGLGQFVKGEVDEVQPTARDLATVASTPGTHIWEYPEFSYQYLGVNTRVKPLDDVRVRQALAYAINRQGIVDQLMEKHGMVLNSPVVPRSWAYDAAGLNPYPYDQAKARQLLADAGYKDRDAEGYLVKDGKRLSFTLTYPKGDPLREQSAPIIQANLKDVGIEVKLDLMGDFATMVDHVFKTHQVQLWLLAWGLPVDPDNSAIWDTSDSTGTFNTATGWTDATANDLLHQGVRTFNQDERKAVYVKWAQILNQDLPYVFLYGPNAIYATAARLQGVQADVRGLTWNIEQWWIPRDQQKGE